MHSQYQLNIKKFILNMKVRCQRRTIISIYKYILISYLLLKFVSLENKTNENNDKSLLIIR